MREHADHKQGAPTFPVPTGIKDKHQYVSPNLIFGHTSKKTFNPVASWQWCISKAVAEDFRQSASYCNASHSLLPTFMS
jgi:hypothetical protein